MKAGCDSAQRGVAVVICAAGSSSRMGGVKKEYQKLKTSENGLTVLGTAVGAFASAPSVKIIVIAIPKGGETAAREALPREYLTVEKPKVLFVEGGETRQASVFNALAALSPYEPSYALIHDGARPWISAALIENIIEAAKKYGAVIPVLPLTETPKEFDAPIWETRTDSETQAVFIKTHLKRASTGSAQTPQGFKFLEILRAHEKAAKEAPHIEFTDDAEIWGMFCGKVAAIPGEQENKKITFAEDL